MPTTIKAGFISTVLEAGYHVELAGGGHYSPTALRAKVAEIQGKISPGTGLTLNLLYINLCQFSFQPPLWQDMCREGLPIEGLCVAAGIPTTEKAAEIISGLKFVGIHHVGFKRGAIVVLQLCIQLTLEPWPAYSWPLPIRAPSSSLRGQLIIYWLAFIRLLMCDCDDTAKQAQPADHTRLVALSWFPHFGSLSLFVCAESSRCMQHVHTIMPSNCQRSAMPEATTHLKISISPFSQPI